jgi:predicted unusual protein kinase regulating ubiquinone biosynthesis (AarF/ABC1/UbiB family)
MAQDDDREPDSLDELRKGLGRTWATARLTAKLGRKAAGRMLFRKKGDPSTATEAAARAAAEEAEVDDAGAIARARALVATMGSLKGLAMKAGQIASYMPGALPPAAQKILAELQAESVAMTFERIDAVVRAELGGGVAELFDSFERTPFAAASIGQVHRAVFAGRPVAVKVQYPGIEELIKSDLKTIGTMVRMSTIGTAADGGALVGELRDRLVEECDYLREAEHQRLFAALLAEVPGAAVPGVEPARTTKRVLSTQLVDADRFPAFVAAAPQAIRDRAGLVIFRACFELLFRRCIYNADPHPGNYLFRADGDVVFLDFGCVRRFEPEMIATWKRLARSILDGNRAGAREGFVALGFVAAKDKKFDWDYQWDAMRLLYRPYLEPGFRYTPEFVRASYGVLMFDNPNRRRIAMPPAWLFLNRLQWGLNAVLAQLGCTGPWGTVIRELVEAPVEPV